MSKVELVELIAKEAGLSKADAQRALDATLAGITAGLKKEGKVSLVGFGTFSAKKRAARNYRIAVPQFYSGNLQLLLPVVLGGAGEADLALVFKRYQYEDKPESKNKFYYKVYSNLTLAMAYNNARLLSRPASEWLDKVLDKE